MVSDSNLFFTCYFLLACEGIRSQMSCKGNIYKSFFPVWENKQKHQFNIRQVSQRGVTLRKSTTVLPPGNISSTTIFGERAEVD